MTTDALRDPWTPVRDAPDELTLLHSRVAHRFGRPEPRRRALAYLRGLATLRGDRNGQALASAAGESRPDGMQRLLTAAGWDADLVRDDLLAYVRERYVHASAALVVDEVVLTGRGPSFVGATPRYLPDTGRVESCQVAVLAAYDTPEHSVLVDRELCLPSPWDTDRRLRHAAGIPPDHHRHSGRELAGAMVERALRRLPLRWVVLGVALGPDDRLRSWLAGREVAFVAPVGPGTTLGATAGRRVTAAAVAAHADDLPWTSVPDAGAPITGWDTAWTWAQVRVRPSRDGRWEHRLLLRAAGSPGADGSPRAECPPGAGGSPGAGGLRFYACHVPRGTSLEELVGAARRAGAVRAGAGRARATVGLDSYRVRGWTGWYRHVTLAMLADAAAAVDSATAEVRSPDESAAPREPAKNVATGTRQFTRGSLPTKDAAP
ncbi:IS701 family transposase [Parafrankia discariae]|uniref:IS701 family transposase n=1 Tax=Parafrankia discariae TaxID=365528 RepID=UPI0003645D05|nr:transposase [Parafrankia discariae]